MITMKHFFKGSLLLLSSFVFFTSCSDDDPKPKGSAQIEITDAPIDDASIQGAFVTIAAVKVDGKEISGFSKTTIDLMAYQNGTTKILGTIDLEEGTYNDVTLVLDYEQDANGNSPGCYILQDNGVKSSLQASTSAYEEIEVNTGDFVVEEGTTTTAVIDFDLRKSIRYEDAPTNDDQFDFVTDNELEASLRVVGKAEAGKISGKASDNLGLAGDKIVVYAYKKGDFTKSTQVEGQGTSEIQFKDAVTSASVDANGDYTLAFLEAGDYELHFFGYEDANNDGTMELKSELELSLVGNLGIDLNSVTVGANATVSVSVLVIGLLP